MKKLNVYIEMEGGQVPVGQISGNSSEDAVFTYQASYMHVGAPISVSLPFQKEPFHAERTRCFFDGLLPEGFTRRSVARWMQKDENDYLSILAGLGKECLGAIQIITEEEPYKEEAFYKKLSLEDVKKLAAEGAERSAEIVVKSHLSLTGASGKVGLYLNAEDEKWYQPFGTAPSTHIVKQSHVRFSNIVENEQMVLLAASELGIQTAKSFIINVKAGENRDRGSEAGDADILLATERYDRDMEDAVRDIDGLKVPLRLHQEDFSQALGIPSSEKYEKPGDGYLAKIFRLVRNVSDNPIRDQQMLLDMMIFDVLIGNTDNHIKNISLLYGRDLKRVRLAPAYDKLSTLIYKEGTSEMSIAVAGEREWSRIDRNVFAAASSEIGISRAMILREYDRLKESLPEALHRAEEILEKQGFQNIGDVYERICNVCRIRKE